MLAQFVQEADVLDRNDGLVGEILHQCNLLVVKGPDLLAENGNDANQIFFFEHRSYQDGTHAT